MSRYYDRPDSYPPLSDATGYTDPQSYVPSFDEAPPIIDPTVSVHEPNTEPISPERLKLTLQHKSLCETALTLMMKKNADYACEADLFRNFRYFGPLGVLVRLSDKLARLRTFEERNTFSVTDESLRDTILDLINYAVIYYAMKKEK